MEAREAGRVIGLLQLLCRVSVLIAGWDRRLESREASGAPRALTARTRRVGLIVKRFMVIECHLEVNEVQRF